MSGRGGGGRGGRGGRDRFRRDYHPRFEDKSSSHSGSGRYNSNSSKIAPPSRHLWVGNLSHSLSESELTHHFLYFGDLESIAFQPGRSYAFLNFCREDDAIAAMKSLQDFPVAGNPLRIEFAKADKSSASSHEEDYSDYQNEQYSDLRESPFLQREFRDRHASPDQFYPEKSSMSHKNAEPSAVLWIGFPASLKVDEMILRKAFSPFGEIEKITAFPGRSYAFVRFRSLTSACRAKDTLQGKLFGNPRVHICFAKSDTGSSNGGRNSINVPSSPRLRLNDRLGSSENFWQERKLGSLTGDPSTRSQIFSDLDSGDSDSYNTNRKNALWSSGINSFEKRRFGEVGSERGVSPDRYEYQSSPTPTREKHGHLHDLSRRLPQTSKLYEEPWDLPEDAHFFHGAKKLKISSFPLDKELPEYPFSDSEQEEHVFPRPFSDFPQSDYYDRKFDAGPSAYKRIHDYPMNLSLPQEERIDRWKESYDSIQLGSAALLSNPVDRKRLTPESDCSSLNEWKWEGTIAKGGTPVCRARCFPVGKILDIILPDFLDCTARTGLDMLSKHYYQAASAFVVFFVPGSDADIGFYNEFMHYLGEKKRAAVAKLDEMTTLFLVPPSDFSQKVLKVPGKLSISGVILRLEHPSYNIGSLHHQQERRDTLSFPVNTSTYFPESSRSGGSNLSFSGNVISSAPTASFSGSGHAVGNKSDPREDRHEYHPVHANPRSGPNWSSQHMQNSVPGSRITPSQVSHGHVDPRIQEHPSNLTRAMQETGSANSTFGTSGISSSGNSKSSLQETQSGVSLSMPNASLQSQQLAQLASSLLGQQRHSGSNANASIGNDFRQANAMVESENMYGASQKYTSDGNSQFNQAKLPQQSLQQTSNVSAVPHSIEGELKTGAQANQQLQNTSSHEEAEADPQKRLQATLQLAAALLQQIQQGKGN